MKPVYDQDGIAIYHGDCREILPELKADLLLADPPYGIGFVRGNGGKAVSNNPGAAFTNRKSMAPIIGDDRPFDPAEYFNPADYRSMILWGANHYHHRLPAGGRWIAWNKLGHIEPFDTFSDVEFAWFSDPGKDLIFSCLWKGVLQDDKTDNGRRWHPSQKPGKLMRWCIELVPNAQVVLDPFMGSGTTLVAAKALGKRAIGIEIESKYIDVAIQRLAQQVMTFEEAS